MINNIYEVSLHEIFHETNTIPISKIVQNNS